MEGTCDGTAIGVTSNRPWELPRLVTRPEVRRQVEERIDELVTQQSDIASGLDQTAKALLQRLQFLQSEVARLEGVLDDRH